MAKIKIKIPLLPKLKLSISNPKTWQRPSAESLIIKFGALASLMSIVTMILSFIVMPIFVETVNAEFAFYGLVQRVAILMLSLGVISFLFVGRERLADIPEFMVVLVFALLTTSAYLLSTQTPLNTIGTSGFTYLSAISILAFTSIYALGYSFIDKAHKRKLLLNTLAVVIGCISVVAIFVPQHPYLASIVLMALPAALVTIAFRGYFLLKLVILLAGLVMLTQPLSWQLWLAIFFSSLVITSARRGDLKAFPADWKKLFAGIQSFSDFYTKYYWLLTGLLALVSFAVLAVGATQQTAVVSYINSLVSEIGRIVGVGRELDLDRFLVGLGATPVTIQVYSTLSIVLSFLGITGVFSVLIAGLAFISTSTRLLFKSDPDSFFPYLLVSTAVAVPVLGVFSVLTYPIVAWWWLMFSFSAILLFPLSLEFKVRDWYLKKLGKYSKYLSPLRILLVMGVLVLTIIMIK